MSLEIKQLTLSKPPYFYREYENDVPKNCENSWLAQAKRVTLVALPFFSLYKPFGFPIALVMGSVRVFTCSSELLSGIAHKDIKAIAFATLQTTIAVIALASTIFAHPLGMLVTSAQDIVIETVRLIRHLQNGDYKQAIISCLSIINNALYISLFLHGGPELIIASLAIQILIGLIHSCDEFQNGNYLEGMGHLLMATIRGNQLTGQVKLLKVEGICKTPFRAKFVLFASV